MTEDTRELALRVLARSAASAERNRAIRELAAGYHASRDLGISEDTTSPVTLDRLEDAAWRHEALRIRYFSVDRGDTDDRLVSIHRFRYAAAISFLATCHRAQALRWFRADQVESAELAVGVEFLKAEGAAIDAFVSESVNGYHGAEPVADHVCFVRQPDARWVRRNLPGRPLVETVPGGVRITWRAAALLPLARFVVGLGSAAVAESPDLGRRVEELARGALGGSANLDR